MTVVYGVLLFMGTAIRGSGFEVSFSAHQVTAWGGLALFKQRLDRLEFRQAVSGWGLPVSGSNRGYDPRPLIDPFVVSIGCGACRFVPAETVRLDGTLPRLFGWSRAAGHKAIMRLFGRFDRLTNERGQAPSYRGFFDKISALEPVTLDVDSTVITRNGEQQGAVRGYNPNKRGRSSHHPVLAFVAEARMVANFWLRPGKTHSANHLLQFLESTRAPLGPKRIGRRRADSGFFDDAIRCELERQYTAYIIAARLTQVLQRKIYQTPGGWALEAGLELTELRYPAADWKEARRLIVVRQSVKRQKALGKNRSLFADDPDIQGWRYGAFVTSLELPRVEVWRTYRGRADGENRIKELKADFGLEAFNMHDFWITEAVLRFAMLAYNLMSLFRQAVRRSKVQHTLSTLQGQVLAVGGSGGKDAANHRLILYLPRKKRAWFAGLCNNPSDPPFFPFSSSANG
jgi:hypothetical protein